MEIRVGDIVKLKGNTIEMVVSGINTMSNPEAYCLWYNKKGNLTSAFIKVKLLEKI